MKTRKPSTVRKRRTLSQIAEHLNFSGITFPEFKRLSLANKVRFLRWNDPDGEYKWMADRTNQLAFGIKKIHAVADDAARSMLR